MPASSPGATELQPRSSGTGLCSLVSLGRTPQKSSPSSPSRASYSGRHKTWAVLLEPLASNRERLSLCRISCLSIPSHLISTKPLGCDAAAFAAKLSVFPVAGLALLPFSFPPSLSCCAGRPVSAPPRDFWLPPKVCASLPRRPCASNSTTQLAICLSCQVPSIDFPAGPLVRTKSRARGAAAEPGKQPPKRRPIARESF